jgi:hypothetical protein
MGVPDPRGGLVRRGAAGAGPAPTPRDASGMRIFPALVVAAFLSNAAVAAAAPEPSFVLPTVACGDYYIVQMQVNGDPERVLEMLLDTGASHTVIDVESVARVGGKPAGPGGRARFARLVAGEVTFRGVRARIRQLDHLQRVLGVPFDGILGFPTFRDILLTIDFPAKQVRVSRGALSAPDGNRILRTVKEKRRPVIDLDFGAGGRPVLIDSGSAGGFLLRETDRLNFETPPVAYDSSLRIDRIMIRSGARLAGSVNFGGITLVRPTVSIGGRVELVGTAVLRHFVATFDQKRERVLLERSSPEPIEFPPLRDVGWSLRPRANGYEIERVFDGFGADRAGLLAGDLVLAVDGTPVYEQDLCDRGPEQREQITVTLERDGEQMEFRVAIDTVVP